MNTIRLFVDVDSENVHIPELKRFVGKRVEIIILEVSSIKLNEKKKRDMKRFFDAAGKIKIDKESINQLREASKL